MLDPVDLTRALLAIPSPTGHEHAVTAFLADQLAELGWQVGRQPVRDGRENLFAHRGNPVVVLSTHVDTVPPGGAAMIFSPSFSLNSDRRSFCGSDNDCSCSLPWLIRG